MSRPNIMLSGPPRSGKDTIGAHLVRYYGYRRIALADPLRQMIADCLGITVEELNARPKDETRPLMQALGHGARLLAAEDFWIKRLTEAIGRAELKDGPAPVVVTDLRYPNELAWGKRHSFLTIRLAQPFLDTVGHIVAENPDANRNAVMEQLRHPTERLLHGYECEFDLVVESHIGRIGELLDTVTRWLFGKGLSPSAEGVMTVTGLLVKEAMPQ